MALARGLGVFFDGARLRRARTGAEQGRGMSAAELARRVGASKAQILAYENGLYPPDPQRIAALARQLGVAPLELADTSTMHTWTLADLRRASGLRARDVTARLKVSPRSYRRLENEGLASARQYALAAAVAACLQVSTGDIDRHLNNVPAVAERLTGSRRLLAPLLERHCAPGRLGAVQADEPEVVELAGLYGRPAPTVARLVAHEVAHIRGVQRRQAALGAVADFATSAAEQADARSRQATEAMRIVEATTSLPSRLESFFRCLLPADCWHALALLHVVRAFGLWLTPAQLGIDESAIEAIPAPMLQTSGRPGTGQPRGYQICAAGVEHCEAYRPWYDALYPAVRTALHTRESQIAGHVPGAVLQQHFRQAHTLLFSFDGLLCRVFGPSLPTVSDQLIQTAHALQLPVGPQTPTDPVGMLRHLGRQASRAQYSRLDQVLAQQESEAVRQAEPLAGVQQLLRVLAAGSWRLAVATDHAAAAVEAFLARLEPSIAADRIHVFGRPADPRLMKPHPHTVALAAATLGSPRRRTILIGESVADALAAQAAGILFIGVAATRGKARMLREAGATLHVASLREITSIVRSLTQPPYPAPTGHDA
ncbi:phosphoglycolate phosphatase-like HAD superfamily hydrolase/transcriptional regulator with XRE-family HTH domain [Streptomyces sp. V4I2]|nr:phosphoglycolate phosphatase-like HAD superfamily hydrolase/transcriptional regulator with XRE-family HTH domain [Streptomyces sp. V4I2]